MEGQIWDTLKAGRETQELEVYPFPGTAVGFGDKVNSAMVTGVFEPKLTFFFFAGDGVRRVDDARRMLDGAVGVRASRVGVRDWEGVDGSISGFENLSNSMDAWLTICSPLSDWLLDLGGVVASSPPHDFGDARCMASPTTSGEGPQGDCGEEDCKVWESFK